MYSEFPDSITNWWYTVPVGGDLGVNQPKFMYRKWFLTRTEKHSHHGHNKPNKPNNSSSHRAAKPQSACPFKDFALPQPGEPWCCPLPDSSLDELSQYRPWPCRLELWVVMLNHSWVLLQFIFVYCIARRQKIRLDYHLASSLTWDVKASFRGPPPAL